MLNEEWKGCVRCAGWWVERNPTYLISAGLMAVGARLYLVSPSSRAGDVGLIMLTLGVLQLYMWAVTGILLALRRWGRGAGCAKSSAAAACTPARSAHRNSAKPGCSSGAGFLSAEFG